MNTPNPKKMKANEAKYSALLAMREELTPEEKQEDSVQMLILDHLRCHPSQQFILPA